MDVMFFANNGFNLIENGKKKEENMMKNNLQIYLRENARHGTPDFPVGFYPCSVPHDFYDLPTHWHEEMELTLVKSGTLHYTIGIKQVDVKAGDMLIIAPDTLHSAHRDEEEGAETLSIVFHLNLAGLSSNDACTNRYINPIHNGSVVLPSVVHPGETAYDELRNSFEALWQCSDEELPYRELTFKCEVLRLIRLLWQCSDSTDDSGVVRKRHPHEEKLKMALAYMQSHYSESITVGKLAKLCGFSEVHFMNVFKAIIGATCIEYLIEYRLALAAIDLRETNHPIMQVAMDNGFQNISYFNRTFKKKYDMTPSAYRKLNQKL